MSKNILVLLSGGIDSTALIHYYKSSLFNVQALFVDYGQPALRKEKAAAKNVSEYFNVPLKIADLGFNLKVNEFEIVMRNSLLLNVGLSMKLESFEIISLGIHGGTGYYDCSRKFIVQYQKILDGYFNGSVTIDTPFIEFSKADIYKYSKVNDLPLDLMYSCEVSGECPCGYCPSCRDRERY